MEILTVFFILVHAIAVLKSKRDVAPNVQSCVNNINISATQMDDLLKNVSSKYIIILYAFIKLNNDQINAGSVFTDGRSYDDYLDDIMDATEESCCGIHAVISDADADFFLASVDKVTPKVQAVLSSLTERQGSYNSWTKLIVKGQLRSLDSYTNKLTSCFVVFNPQTKQSTLQGYINQLQAALVSAKTAYNADSWFRH